LVLLEKETGPLPIFSQQVAPKMGGWGIEKISDYAEVFDLW